jgi:hypothetical protein
MRNRQDRLLYAGNATNTETGHIAILEVYTLDPPITNAAFGIGIEFYFPFRGKRKERIVLGSNIPQAFTIVKKALLRLTPQKDKPHLLPLLDFLEAAIAEKLT